ncbi:MAG: DUF6494 family protein [Alphaproteobacteria bacterium]|nr:DUF6494 family protein [Alphaproteobacteria bacterium]
MDEDAFNMSVRKFLKKVGVTSQREIEQAVRDALKDGRIDGASTLTATVRLTVDGVDLNETITGKIDLG